MLKFLVSSLSLFFHHFLQSWTTAKSFIMCSSSPSSEPPPSPMPCLLQTVQTVLSFASGRFFITGNGVRRLRSDHNWANDYLRKARAKSFVLFAMAHLHWSASAQELTSCNDGNTLNWQSSRGGHRCKQTLTELLRFPFHFHLLPSVCPSIFPYFCEILESQY